MNKGDFMEKICSLFGHREVAITAELVSAVEKAIESVIKQGVTKFYFGGFGEFDSLCHKIVSAKRQEFGLVRVYCLEDERYLRINKRPKYLLDEDYEQFVYLPLSYNSWYTRIYYRNCEMIDNSDFVIFYIRNEEKSGAFKAYKYAKRKHKSIISV